MATKKVNTVRRGKGSPKVHRFGSKQKHGNSRATYFAARRFRLGLKKETS